MKQYLTLNDAAYQAIMQTGVREHAVLQALREETYCQMPDTNMPISADQAQFLQWLVGILSAKCIVEVGCFTGYGALAMALALPSDGRLITCDISEEWTAIGQPFWKEAGVGDRIDLRIAPALEILETLLSERMAHTVDLMFIDADKQNYPAYFEYALKLVRPGGVVILDNVIALRELHVNSGSAGAKTIMALNEQIHADARVEISMLAIGGGMTLCRVL